MIKKLTISFATLALAAASAATYKVTLFDSSVVNGKTLQAGDYKVEVNNDKAVFMKGKTSMTEPVKVETADQKFANTTVRYGANQQVQEIHIGGTNTRLVFSGADSTANGTH